ncbi:sodium:proline symporter [Sporosarcina sp. P12(2017)]|uniref:sodium:solute symporter family protein n=1 Tax=unclassified Sporosarcina TaxID=2647733 RepID=UPI000C167CAC|nr:MULTISPECIES: sodium:solute symporter family protein [unclassified Sporosarcina]PIC57268.1 sodium:proline symporter [Sporosarcina sp. P10]PIC60650.1 sodium:proline symporter [Sporosarcina sp. P12(2017)]PIC77298.1 sodium:proline symporter [Sporosarcina sp. P19]
MAWYVTYSSIYFVVMFAIGVYYFTKVKDADSYLIAGWNMSFWSIVGTTISTNVGAAVFIGWVGMGFTVGMSGYFKFALPAYLTSILLIYVFSKPLRRQRLYTMADLFGERFNSKTGVIPSILSAFIYSVPATALQIVGMSTVFSIVFNIDVKVGIFLSFTLILGFTILGGLVAAIVTDALQSFILVIGLFILAFTALKFGDGISNVIAQTPMMYLSPAGPHGVGEVLMFALTVAPFYLIWQSTWQRIFASKSEEVAIRAGITGYVITAIISILPFAIGVTARQFVPADLHPDLIFSYVTVDLLHPAIGGIVIVGLLAALMTGADSFILQGSSNISQDLYFRIINPKASGKQMMFVARFSVVIIAVMALIVSYFMTDIISVYQWALRISATTIVFPFLAVIFWRKTTARGVVTSMIIAGLVTAIWPFFNTGLDQVVPGLSASLIVLIIVSLMTKHSSDETIRAVYWEDLPSASRRIIGDENSELDSVLNK